MSVLLFLTLLFFPLSSWSNPFRTHYICVPKVEPNKSSLEFEIRDQGTCQEDEAFMSVNLQTNGSILLLPAEPPLSSEEKKELEDFKKYNGITR